jgi:hypothetical protein
MKKQLFIENMRIKPLIRLWLFAKTNNYCFTFSIQFLFVWRTPFCIYKRTIFCISVGN